MVEHLPVTINTNKLSIYSFNTSKVCKKNGLMTFQTGRVKKNFGKL